MKVNHLKLRALAMKASPGPWTIDPAEFREDGSRKYFPSLRLHECRSETYKADGTLTINVSNKQTMFEIVATAEFMAMANPLNVIALLDEIDRLRSKVSK